MPRDYFRNGDQEVSIRIPSEPKIETGSDPQDFAEKKESPAEEGIAMCRVITPQR